jgi:hypothetical protein
LRQPGEAELLRSVADGLNGGARTAAVMVGFTGVVILQVGGADLGNRRGYPARSACRPYIAKDS